MFSLPWTRRPPQPEMPEIETIIAQEVRLPLHLLARDARLSVENRMVLVEADDDCRTLRLEEISLIALHGGAQVSVPCLHLLARNGIPMILLSQNGYYLGQLANLSTNHSALKRAQYACFDHRHRALMHARASVRAKLEATTRLARRRLGARDQITRRLRRATKTAARARSASALRGIEGAAAAAWYSAWPRMLGKDDPLFTFDGRTRRPPQDATNALLSYLYAVLTGTVSAAALGCGLDINVGFYHVERPGRPALALDLVEPFRPALVDTAIIAAIRHGEFDAQAFEHHEGGAVRLSDAGRRQALELLERRLSTRLVYAGTEMSWRTAISRYCELFARSLRQPDQPAPIPMPKG